MTTQAKQQQKQSEVLASMLRSAQDELKQKLQRASNLAALIIKNTEETTRLQEQLAALARARAAYEQPVARARQAYDDAVAYAEFAAGRVAENAAITKMEAAKRELDARQHQLTSWDTPARTEEAQLTARLEAMQAETEQARSEQGEIDKRLATLRVVEGEATGELGQALYQECLSEIDELAAQESAIARQLLAARLKTKQAKEQARKRLRNFPGLVKTLQEQHNLCEDDPVCGLIRSAISGHQLASESLPLPASVGSINLLSLLSLPFRELEKHSRRERSYVWVDRAEQLKKALQMYEQWLIRQG